MHEYGMMLKGMGLRRRYFRSVRFLPLPQIPADLHDDRSFLHVTVVAEILRCTYWSMTDGESCSRAAALPQAGGGFINDSI